MNKVLIHIGYHKTGTTWLQNQLFVSGNHRFEPLSRTKNGHSSLANYFISDPDGRLLPSFALNEKAISEELKSILESKGDIRDKFAVLSHERLSGNPHSSGFDSKIIAQRLKHIFPTGKILIVIREQRSFILSNYLQYLKVGGTHSLEKYLNTTYDGKRPHFSPHHIDYLLLVKEYQKLFGPDSVLVLPYEMLQHQPATFIDKLQKFIGAAITMNPDQYEIISNKSHQKFVNYHLRKLNLFLASSSLNDYSDLYSNISKKIITKFRDALDVVVPEYLNKKTQDELQTKINSWCSDRYVNSNRELEKTLNIGLEQYSYY